jgi:AcrR family transcriptional regulator
MEGHPPASGKQRILENAEELFTEHGYKAVSIRDIARASEVTNAALYYYFSNKEALFEAVMEQHATRLKANMQQAGEKNASNREKVIAILEEYAHMAAHRRSPFFLSHRESESMGRSHFKESYGRLVQVILQPLEQILHLATESGELRALPPGHSPAALLVGMLHGHVQYLKACPETDLPYRDIELIVDIFWRGLSPKI